MTMESELDQIENPNKKPKGAYKIIRDQLSATKQNGYLCDFGCPFCPRTEAIEYQMFWHIICDHTGQFKDSNTVNYHFKPKLTKFYHWHHFPKITKFILNQLKKEVDPSPEDVIAN